MVESISSTPVATGLSINDFRAGNNASGGSSADLPSAPAKIAPVQKSERVAPLPPEVPHSESFVAALVAQHIPQNSMTPTELQLRMGGTWQVPDSPLRLTDRTI